MLPLNLLLALLGASVLAAVSVGGAVSWWLSQNAPERRRLRTISDGFSTSTAVATAPLAGNELNPTLARLSGLMPKSPKDMGRLQKRLARAGYPQMSTAVWFSLAQLAMPIVLGGAALLLLGPTNWLYALLAAIVGYLLPAFYVARKTTQRQKLIQNGLADALDLLTICVEAGTGLDQAISRAADELDLAHPALAAELRTVTTETRAGKSRVDAFKNLASRTGVDDIRSLVAMLNQTDRFGTSIGQALRAHAETIRTIRRQRAEERAAKLSVKMVFPLAFCLFPALYVVCFGPIVVRIYHAFF